MNPALGTVSAIYNQYRFLPNNLPSFGHHLPLVAKYRTAAPAPGKRKGEVRLEAEQKAGRGDDTKEAGVLCLPGPSGSLSKAFPTILGPSGGGSCPCQHSMATQGLNRGWASGPDSHLTRPQRGDPQPSLVGPYSQIFGERDCRRNLHHIQSKCCSFLAGVAALVRDPRCRATLPWADVWDPHLGQGSLLGGVPGDETGYPLTQDRFLLLKQRGTRAIAEITSQ